MSDYISREAAINAMGEMPLVWTESAEELQSVVDWEAHVAAIQTIPAADVKPIVHGKWRLNRDGSGTCSVCRFTQPSVWDLDRWQNFCAHCGADMRGEADGHID